MIAEPRCPSCGAERWRALGQHTYRAADLDRRRRPLTAYQRLRLRVLFEVWMPGAGQIELRTLLCGSCGFVTFAPRPSVADLEAKYRFLATQEPDESGAGARAPHPAAPRRAARALPAAT